jgi:hypothetical protein
MTIPSNSWFPQSLQERAAWYDNFNTQMQAIGTTLGLTAGDLSDVQKDNDVMQFLANTAVEADAFIDAIRQYRKIITEGEIGDPNPPFPANPAFALPASVDTGMFERLVDWVDRIRAAPAYTGEQGALAQIIPQQDEEIEETELKPALKASSLPGNQVEVGFTRGKTQGIEIEIRVDNDAAWQNVGRYFSSPAALDIADGTGLPRGVQIRARYVKNNQAVGLNSDTVNVVTTP